MMLLSNPKLCDVVITNVCFLFLYLDKYNRPRGAKFCVVKLCTLFFKTVNYKKS